MANINLLPWRAERRQKRQQEFYGVIGLVVLVAGYGGSYANTDNNGNWIATPYPVIL